MKKLLLVKLMLQEARGPDLYNSKANSVLNCASGIILIVAVLFYFLSLEFKRYSKVLGKQESFPRCSCNHNFANALAKGNYNIFYKNISVSIVI